MADFRNPVLHHHIAVTVVPPDEKTYEHDHDFHEVFLVLDGEGLHHFNGKSTKLEKGNLIWIRPEDCHAFSTSPSSHLRFINLAVTDEWWQSFRTTISTPTGPLAAIRETPAMLGTDGIDACSSDLQQLMETESPALALTRAMANILDHYMRHDTARVIAKVRPRWFSDWLELMGQDTLLAQPLAFWQAQAGVSAEHLARTCRQHLKQTPTEVINIARVRWVQEKLLERRERSIDLALDIGFNNIGYFYRCFRRYSGCTPQEWLDRQRRSPVLA